MTIADDKAQALSIGMILGGSTASNRGWVRAVRQIGLDGGVEAICVSRVRGVAVGVGLVVLAVAVTSCGSPAVVSPSFTPPVEWTGDHLGIIYNLSIGSCSSTSGGKAPVSADRIDTPHTAAPPPAAGGGTAPITPLPSSTQKAKPQKHASATDRPWWEVAWSGMQWAARQVTDGPLSGVVDGVCMFAFGIVGTVCSAVKLAAFAVQGRVAEMGVEVLGMVSGGLASNAVLAVGAMIRVSKVVEAAGSATRGALRPLETATVWSARGAEVVAGNTMNIVLARPPVGIPEEPTRPGWMSQRTV